MKAMEPVRIAGLILLAGVLLLLPAQATAAPTPAGAATPEQAVSTLLEPFYNPAANSNACNALSGQFAACPMSARLRQRLEQATENGNILIRAQNPPRSVTVKPVDNDGQTARVAAVFDSGTTSYSITYTVIKQADGWVVDDSFCTADPGSSIYNPPTGPCPLEARGPGTPGMPTTGSATLLTPALALVIGAGLLALFTGLLARRAGSRGQER